MTLDEVARQLRGRTITEAQVVSLCGSACVCLELDNGKRTTLWARLDEVRGNQVGERLPRYSAELCMEITDGR